MFQYDCFRPGKTWYDTEGKRIQAHGGSIITVGDTFYWYGENKEGITGYARGVREPAWHHGVRAYASKDLYNWEDLGMIMMEQEDRDNPFHPEAIMDRPHIIYCAETGKFMMWAKCAGKEFATSDFGLCESESITGPFRFVKMIKCGPFHCGDFDLVEWEGKGYAIYENPHDRMIVHEMNDTYSDLTEVYSEHLFRDGPPFAREAPGHFFRGGRHYLLTSGTTGYFPNPSEMHVFDDFHGEWEDLGDPCVDDKNHNSFCAQFSSVFAHPTVPDLYIALGDRWLTDLSHDTPDMRDVFYKIFHPEEGGLPEGFNMNDYSDSNTGEANYVWLPIRFREDGMPYIEWTNKWRIEDFIQK